MRKRLMCMSLLIIVFLMMFSATPALAQQKCHEFRAATQSHLKFWLLDGVGPIGLWVGKCAAKFGGFPEMLYAEFDPEELPPPPPPDYQSFNHGNITIEKGSLSVFDFGNGNTLTLRGNAHFQNIPFGASGFSDFQATWKVVDGTGIFAGATGNLLERGPFFVEFGALGDFPPVSNSLYNAEYSGMICVNK
jgi:hypothetical protein